jgi:hypothetical protein
MNKVIVTISAGPQIYTPDPGQTPAQVAAGCGVTDPALYAEFDSADFDAECYNFISAFSLSAGTVSFDLSVAKDLACNQEKARIAELESSAANGYSASQLAAQSALAKSSRVPEVQSAIEALNALATELSTNIAAITAATTIAEVDAIVNPSTDQGEQ